LLVGIVVFTDFLNIISAELNFDELIKFDSMRAIQQNLALFPSPFIEK